MATLRTGRTRARSSPNFGSRVRLGHKEFKTGAPPEWKPYPGQQGVGIYADSYHKFSTWEMTSDENHGRPPYNIGGPFQKISCTVFPAGGSGPIGASIYYTRDGNVRYIGGFGVGEMGGFYEPSWFLNPEAPRSTKNDLLPNMSAPVTKAWNGARPKIQQVNGFAALAEIGEVPSMLRTTAQGLRDSFRAAGGRLDTPTMQPQGAANHFLNHQFGWVPFLSDVRGTINTYQNSHNIINRLTRNNGRDVRRRVTVQQSVSEKVVLEGGGSLFDPYLGPDFCVQGQDATWKIVDVESIVTTGSGAFRYYMPEFDMGQPEYHSAMNNARRQMAIYGVRINPGNLYQIVPWSWAVDWVSNVGDYVQRFSDEFSDNLVARYFYVMHHYVLERRYITTIPTHTMGPVELVATRKLVTKQRVEGSSPFGVNLSWDQLSPRQLAIAGALGITHLS